MAVYPYQSREVRDLAWACFSPPLLVSESLEGGLGNAVFPLTTRRRAWLERLDRNADPLREHLSLLRSRRLGLYFESLWHFFLSSDPEVELIAHNLPVQGEGRTLGEFDCIYYCHTRQRHVHLELAVKFYLGTTSHGADQSQTSEWRNWLGPNTRDRLDLKLAHLLQHQIRLSEIQQAADQLQRLGIVKPLREIEIKGYLFQPAGRQYAPPTAFNPVQKLYNWVSVENLSSTPEMSSSQGFLVLPRNRWLSPAREDGNRESYSAKALVDEVANYFQSSLQPLLVAALDEQGNETSRFFVTGARWPDLA